MSDFAGMEDLLQDFLLEAGDLLSDVDNKLVELENSPQDLSLLTVIFRGFHTIKGGASFLNAVELVNICHLTENLFDKLRTGELLVTGVMMDTILEATLTVREMFDSLERRMQPAAAPADLIQRLALSLEAAGTSHAESEATASESSGASGSANGPNWEVLYSAVSQKNGPARQDAPPLVEASEPQKVLARKAPASAIMERSKETSIRVDTERLDQVLNLSGEIGLTKNRLNALRSDMINGNDEIETLHALDLAVSQLDLLVSDLQNAVMKTRMQPIGRLFQKYPRIARDLARSLGKDVELCLVGEDTEIDKTMIEDLADPIIHLVRNAVDHGVETPRGREMAHKPAKSIVRLEARQDGDHIVILISDDGRGMDPEKLRAKALDKGLITVEEAASMDERQSFSLIFLPGFSMASAVSDVSGRGVGMDVVRTNIQKLNGEIDVRSVLGEGTAFVINLPLTLAILPVLLVRIGEQPLAIPLSMVREILPISIDELQEIGGRSTMVIRNEVLPIHSLAILLGWESKPPEYGVVMQAAEQNFILAIDGFTGREDAVIKSLDDFRPCGVAGVTTLSNGQIALILDIKELLSNKEKHGMRREDFLEAQLTA